MLRRWWAACLQLHSGAEPKFGQDRESIQIWHCTVVLADMQAAVHKGNESACTQAPCIPMDVSVHEAGEPVAS